MVRLKESWEREVGNNNKIVKTCIGIEAIKREIIEHNRNCFTEAHKTKVLKGKCIKIIK